ncbi:MAG: DUF481 domain-containing protein [Bacteroidota bacterium]
MYTIRKLHYAILIGIFLFPVEAIAQIVNIEDRRTRLDSTGWQGQIDLAAQLVENANRVLTVSAGLRLDALGEKSHSLVLLDYRLVENGGDKLLDNGFAHFRYGLDIGQRFRWEAFTQAQYNLQLRLSFRWLIGTGPRFALLPQNSNRKLFLGILYMFEYDEFEASALTYRDHRISSYISARVPLGEQIVFTSTSYYQPRLIDFSVPRISSVNRLEFTFNSTLSFTTSLNLTYDGRLSRDFPEVPDLVYNWLNGLRLNF